MIDNQFVREAVECSAIDRGIERFGDDELKALKRIMDRQALHAAQGDEESFFEADEQMHAFFLALAGHPQAWRVVENAKAQLDRVRHLAMRLPNKLSTVLAEHRAVVDRFIARDRLGAVEAMRTHLRGVFRSIEILKRENPDYFAASAPGGRARTVTSSVAEARDQKRLARGRQERT